jgi:DNA-3-methyladenine glycosylase
MIVLPGFVPATRDFFARDSLTVGPALLGTVLARTDADGTVAIRLTEVEAYGGERDPGAHAFRGRTARTASMFGEAGHVYCYFTYGMHHAVNLVTGQVGQPYGCLVRAGEVVLGADLARARREAKPPGKSTVPTCSAASGVSGCRRSTSCCRIPPVRGWV